MMSITLYLSSKLLRLPSALAARISRQLRRALAVLLAATFIVVLLTATLRSPRQHPQQEQQQQPRDSQRQPGVAAAAAAAADADAAPWAAKRPNAQLLIPRRIHHYFATTTAIPARLVQEITSWADNHRDYDVHYWDAECVERTLLTKPEYARYRRYYWNGTSSSHERELIAKLLILHSVGGIVADLNMRSLREATDYLTDASCVLAQDRVEKAAFAYGLEALPSVAFMACRPGHHFLAYFLRKITEVEFRTGAVVLEVGTATFLVHAFNAAVAAFDEECSAGRVSCDFRDRVALAEPHVFLPVMEAGMYDSLVDNCRARARLDFMRKEACYNLDVSGNRPTPASLAMPVYVEAWAPNKDLPLLPLGKIGPSGAGRKPVWHRWSLGMKPEGRNLTAATP